MLDEKSIKISISKLHLPNYLYEILEVNNINSIDELVALYLDEKLRELNGIGLILEEVIISKLVKYLYKRNQELHKKLKIDAQLIDNFVDKKLMDGHLDRFLTKKFAELTQNIMPEYKQGLIQALASMRYKIDDHLNQNINELSTITLELSSLLNKINIREKSYA
jgi:hypothetical protein